MAPEAAHIAEVMGGPQVLGRAVRSLRELSEAVSEGLPKDALRRTVRRVFSRPREADEVMYRVVPPATYKRRRTRLKAHESERTERLARVIAAAETVWNDREKAHRWLTKPHPELNRKAPLNYALSELGARQVEDLLDRIYYGLPL
ncbi:MAG TPA: antitoxin Xre/MbcA/ParS toxin-binding domain-containing protein [Terriglobales bacterium]|jgi:putative toxin-antitoxin system antitoxin component (TIGR02293 family)